MNRNLISLLLIIGVLIITSCPEPADGDDGTDFSSGESVIHTANSVSFAMNYVPPGGPLTMFEDGGSTTQVVTLTNGFWMGETEVTQSLWEDVMTDWPGTDPDGTDWGFGADYPAYYLNWYDAVEFCNALTIAEEGADANCVYYSDSGYSTVYTFGTAVYADFRKTGYRLPTEAEWEYAARWIDGSNWNGGDHVSGDLSAPYYSSAVVGNYAWYWNNNIGTPGDSTYGSKEVGTKTPNALGLYDMSGNVYEWCYDWFGGYSGGTVTNPAGAESGSGRVLRNGGWLSMDVQMRCSDRTGANPEARSADAGFRLCRTAD